MRLGQTIAAKREKTETESERLKMHEKQKKRSTINVITLAVGLLAVTVFLGSVVFNLIDSNDTVMKQQEKVPEATVEIVDENGKQYLTEKMKRYVGLLEQDLKDEKQILTRAVIPSGKMREIDVYIKGRKEYYKCNLDRNPAETAEDIRRMKEFLEKQGLAPGYVDVRIEQQSYYQ